MGTLRSALFIGCVLASSFLVIGDNTTDIFDYVQGLSQTLINHGGANLTEFASMILTAPVPLLMELMNGSHTLIAPSNAAIGSVSSSVTNNANLGCVFGNNYDNFLRYQTLAGTLQDVPGSQQFSPVHAFYRTLLRDGPCVNLPGHQAQVLGFVHFIAEDGPTSAMLLWDWAPLQAPIPYINLDIRILGNDAAVLAPPTLTALTRIYSIDPFHSFYMWGSWLLFLSSTALQILDNLQGVTVFACIDWTFTTDVNQTFNTYSDPASKSAIFGNLYVPGIALYSPMIDENTTLVTASGQQLSFVKNSTALYVISNGVMAKMSNPDVIVAGGVLHQIDSMLFNTNVDLAAASSAASSVSSLMATQTSIATTPLGSISSVASSIPSPSVTSTPSPSITSTPRRHPIGAIIGGAVGGVALLAFCVLGSCLLVRHRRKHGKAAWVSGESSSSEKGDWGSPRLPFDANVVEAYEVLHDAPNPDTRNRDVGAAHPYEMVNLLRLNDANADKRGRPPQLAAHRASIDPPLRTDGNYQHAQSSESHDGAGEGANRQAEDSPQPEASPRSPSSARDVMLMANAAAEILPHRTMSHQPSSSSSGLGSIEATGSSSALSADYWASVAAAGEDKTRISTIENPGPAESEGDAEAHFEAKSWQTTAPPAYQQ